MTVRIHRTKNIKVFTKNWLVKFIWLEMWILHAKFLIQHSKGFDQDLYAKFHPNIYRYYDNGLWTKYTHKIALHIFPKKNLIQPWKQRCKRELFDFWPYWSVATWTPFRSKITWNKLTFGENKQNIKESTLKINGISSTFYSPKPH